MIETIYLAWYALCEQVWQADLATLPEPQRSTTRTIWERQISNFFEISWCLTEDGTATNLLDRRKNWRSWPTIEEPGVKCMMMDGWQELSGEPRPGQAVTAFWKQLREQGRQSIRTDLRDSESLCALAYVKRRFVHNFHKLNATMPGGWTLKGWALPKSVPSVGYLAAAHWLAETIQKADSVEAAEPIWQLHDALEGLDSGGEGKINLRCVTEALRFGSAGRHQWARLDGQYLFDFVLEKEKKDPEFGESAANALKWLERVKKTTNTKPSPFYAILLMDGDSLGSQMSDQRKQQPISAALNDFTRQVPEVVRNHNGFLVYAGGDDVLALLPVEDAMACAYSVRQVWEQYFADAKQQHGISTSISAAIEYCHFKSPLAHGLGDAHHLLDDIAKDKTGRDSLAVRVWKPGGLHLEWSAPWSKVVGDKEQLIIPELAKTVRRAVAQDSGFARGFLNKAEALFATLVPEGKLWENAEALEALLTAQWLQSGKVEGIEPSELCKDLIEQCRRYQRRVGEEKKTASIDKIPVEFCDDALKLVWFLATKEMDRENQL